MKRLTVRIGVLLALFVLTGTVNAQLDIRWSEKQIYDNKVDGFFKTFLGSNSNYVYAKFTGYNRKDFTERLVAFDKTTMKRAASTMIVDLKKNPTLKEQYKGLDYYKTIVFEDIIYTFWSKKDKEKQELFVQTFSSKLQPLNKLKKVYELPSGDKRSAKKARLFVMGNKDSHEQILIGGELAANKDEAVMMEYKLLNKDLSFAASSRIKLPVTITGKSSGLTSDYEMGDDGNLYIKTFVSMSKEERKAAKKGESTRYPIFSLLNLTTGEMKPYTIKFDNKNIFNFDFIVTDEALKIFGFFCDLTKDPKGNDTHGIFYALVDNKSFEIKDMNFSNFTKEQLNQLYVRDLEDRTGKKRKKKKGQAEEETLAADYVIEDVQSLDKDHLVLFCSRMNNYTRQVCSTDSKGNTTCRTVYYCQKSNVTAFKLFRDGSIVWASNMDRSITYNGWDVYDVKVINRGDRFYVTYGSSYYAAAEKKNRKSRKSNKHKADKFEYAVFNYSDGSFNKAEHQFNPVNVAKEDKKYVTVSRITVMDNNFYVNSSKIKTKTISIVAGILSCFVCPLAPWIILNNGNSKIGDGNIGLIEPIL